MVNLKIIKMGVNNNLYYSIMSILIFLVAYASCEGKTGNGYLLVSDAGEDGEKDIFELWTKEVEQGMDKDFEEFMKEMEHIAAGDGTKRDIEQTEISLTNVQTREFMSQNTVDKGQELLQSMRKDVTDEFKKFLKDQQTRMESNFESFLNGMEKEMDDDFDEFYQWMMGKDNARTVSVYQEKYNLWKKSQVNDAFTQYQVFSQSKSQ